MNTNCRYLKSLFWWFQRPCQMWVYSCVGTDHLLTMACIFLVLWMSHNLALNVRQQRVRQHTLKLGMGRTARPARPFSGQLRLSRQELGWDWDFCEGDSQCATTFTVLQLQVWVSAGLLGGFPPCSCPTRVPRSQSLCTCAFPQCQLLCFYHTAPAHLGVGMWGSSTVMTQPQSWSYSSPSGKQPLWAQVAPASLPQVGFCFPFSCSH